MSYEPMTDSDIINYIAQHTRDTGYFSIQFNEHKATYNTVHSYLFWPNPDYEEGEGFESLQDYQECIKTDIMWGITWYSDSPTSSYNTYGSTLEKALNLMLKICIEERGLENSDE